MQAAESWSGAMVESRERKIIFHPWSLFWFCSKFLGLAERSHGTHRQVIIISSRITMRRHVKINHMKCTDTFNDYQDGFTCRALLTKKRRLETSPWRLLETSSLKVYFFPSVVAGPVERVVNGSWVILVTDAALLSQHLALLRPNLRFMCLEEKHSGLAVATQAEPAEAGSAHVYM